jgi:hypothetical protein
MSELVRAHANACFKSGSESGKVLGSCAKMEHFFIFVLAECYHLRLGIWIRIQNILDMLDLDSGSFMMNINPQQA